MGRQPAEQGKRDPCIPAYRACSWNRGSEEGNIDLISLLVKSALVTTRSEGRRAIEQGGVSVDGEKVTDIRHVLSKDALTGDGIVLKRGKKKFNKVFVK